VATGCGGGDDDGGSAAGGGEERTVLVDYRHDQFASAFLRYYPEQVKVRQGDTVRFKQAWTGEPHSVTMGKVVDDLFANMELLEKVAPNRPNITRHLPTALLLVGLVFLTVALAGPTADKRVPPNRATVVLVIDVSLSMKATEVEPSRLSAAQ